MLLAHMQRAGGSLDVANKGFSPVYRDNEINHCPGCGRTHWHIGRILAECAFCSTALPLQEQSVSSTMHRRREFTVINGG